MSLLHRDNKLDLHPFHDLSFLRAGQMNMEVDEGKEREGDAVNE
jgi:hypothetical protein